MRPWFSAMYMFIVCLLISYASPLILVFLLISSLAGCCKRQLNLALVFVFILCCSYFPYQAKRLAWGNVFQMTVGLCPVGFKGKLSQSKWTIATVKHVPADCWLAADHRMRRLFQLKWMTAAVTLCWRLATSPSTALKNISMSLTLLYSGIFTFVVACAVFWYWCFHLFWYVCVVTC